MSMYRLSNSQAPRSARICPAWWNAQTCSTLLRSVTGCLLRSLSQTLRALSQKSGRSGDAGKQNHSGRYLLYQAQHRHGQGKSTMLKRILLIVLRSKMKGKEKSNVGTRQPYLRVLGIRIDTDGVGRSSAQTLTTAEEEEFVRFSQTPNVYETIATSVAPSIYGATDIKKAVACLLFGGSRKRSVAQRHWENLLFPSVYPMGCFVVVMSTFFWSVIRVRPNLNSWNLRKKSHQQG